MHRSRTLLALLLALGLGGLIPCASPVISPAAAQDGEKPAKEPDPAESGRDFKLGRVIGASLAATIYGQIHQVGYVAEALGTPSLPAPTAKVHLGALTGLTRALMGEIDQALPAVPAADREALTVFKRTLDRILAAIAALTAYVEAPSTEAAEAWRKARQEAWDDVCKRLELTPEVAQMVAPGGARLGAR